MRAGMVLQRYWENEHKIRAIELDIGAPFDALADKPELANDAVLDELEALLESREALLLALLDHERRKVKATRVVDFSYYRKLCHIKE